VARPPKRRWALGQGIYADAHGITVQARIGTAGKPNFRQSPPVRFGRHDADGVPYSRSHNRELVECYLRLRGALSDARSDAGGAGSLGEAFTQFLAAHPKPAGVESSRAHDYHTHVRAWQQTPLVQLPVTHVPRKAIVDALDAWTAAGKAPTTVNRRKQILAHVLRAALEPDEAGIYTLPTDNIPDVPPRTYAPRGFDLAIVARILAACPDRGQARKGQTRGTVSLTKIRLTVMAWTGLARTSLIRLEKKKVDFRLGRIYVPPRKKGKGVEGMWAPLLPPALEALKQYDAAKLWGTRFSKSSYRKSWVRAVARVQAELEAAATAPDASETAIAMLHQWRAAVPPHCKPYDLRHSFGTDAYQKSGDIYAVAALMQHKELSTTEHYISAGVPAAVQAAIAKMHDAWFPNVPKPTDAPARVFHLVAKPGA